MVDFRRLDKEKENIGNQLRFAINILEDATDGDDIAMAQFHVDKAKELLDHLQLAIDED